MKFAEIASRLTGFSSPVFGVSWQAPEPEVTAARRLLIKLEDKRVLYAPDHLEVPEYCVASVLQLRELLTEELAKAGSSSPLSDHISAMRAAARGFLNRTQFPDREIVLHARDGSHYASWVFRDALGQMRGVFGVHIAQVATRYGLDVEDELARILPCGADAE
ncbi:MAG: DUF6650 family protein [Planctomycetota bacterium]